MNIAIILLFLAVSNGLIPSRPFLGKVTRQSTQLHDLRRYPLSRRYYEEHLKRLNSKNATIQNEAILTGDRFKERMRKYKKIPLLDLDEDDDEDEVEDDVDEDNNGEDAEDHAPDSEAAPQKTPGLRIIISNGGKMDPAFESLFGVKPSGNGEGDTFEKFKRRTNKKSENFEVVTDSPITFKDVGGYSNVKAELAQCVDLLKNHTKYQNFNVRTPKGLVLEGPPGNGKTLIAKALAGEAGVGFISVSGSQFQEKYVGVGSSRVRELFNLARAHIPCIIFIDEIDALGRARSGDGEQSTTERDSTLNELLVALDGFKNISGIFLVGATNRADLLDPALIRPGRIDKRVFIGLPDEETRRAVINIHIAGKPHDKTVSVDDLVSLTNGLSCAQLENVLNEAMLNALRQDRQYMDANDINTMIDKIMVGWQATEHKFTQDIIDHIAIHEMGHVVLGLISKHHSEVSKVVINLSAPKSPAYTVFKSDPSNIYTREALFEHLMILLGGRIAEEVFYNVSVTTGAINDFEEALKLAQKMIVYYGMGKNAIYPQNSEKYREMVDDEVIHLINDAYTFSEFIIRNSKDFIRDTAEMLKRDKSISAETLNHLVETQYKNILQLKI
jgi:cell division protease FtsH